MSHEVTHAEPDILPPDPWTSVAVESDAAVIERSWDEPDRFAELQVPGVTVETVDAFGRPTLALGQTEDWLHQELLLDPTTYAYRGERGSRVVSERVTTAIVDAPGETGQ
jgi:hypothetical protein